MVISRYRAGKYFVLTAIINYSLVDCSEHAHSPSLSIMVTVATEKAGSI